MKNLIGDVKEIAVNILKHRAAFGVTFSECFDGGLKLPDVGVSPPKRPSSSESEWRGVLSGAC